MSDEHKQHAQHQKEDIQIVLEIWKKTIDVQQHFNDLELQIRNFATTILVAALGAAGLALGAHVIVSFFGRRVMLAPLLLAAGLAGWLAFYFMDALWYHRLLRGAVNHAESIESRLKESLPSITLTTAISDASRFRLWIVGWRVKAATRLHIFYLSVTAVMCLIIWQLLAK